MDCSMPGFPVLHHLLELVQTHVHWVSDAIQPSHPCHPLLLLPSIFPSIRIFSNELTLYIRWPKYWRFSFSISLSNEWWSPWGHKESDTTERLIWSDLMVFPVVMYGCESWTIKKKLSAKELMLLNCGVGEDSWESLGLQGDQTSQF